MPRVSKKNKKEDEPLLNDGLYFDIISPTDDRVEEKIEEAPKKKSNFAIPIRKESFNTPTIRTRTIETEDEMIEEIVVESPKIKEDMSYEATELIEEINDEVKDIEDLISNKRPKKHLKIKNPFKFNLGKNKFVKAFGFGIVLVALILLLSTFVFNSASIEIVTQKGAVEYTGNILVDTNVSESNFSQNVLKGRLVKVEKTIEKTYNATGKITGGAKAKGKITIYNAFNTSPQILVANTRFENPDGLIFRLDSRVVIPGGVLKNGELVASSLDASVTAEEVGEGYNIAPGRFSIPGFKGTDRFTGFYAESKVKFAGGSKGESTVVSNIDLKNAEKDANENLIKDLETELSKQIVSTERSFKDAKSTTISSIKFDSKIGDSNPTFKVSMVGTIKTIVFSKEEYLTLIKNNVKSAVEASDVLYKEPIETISNIKINDKNNQMTISLNVKYPTKKILKENEILQIVKGKDASLVEKLLKTNPSISSAKIKVKPQWNNKIPVNVSKIHLGID